MNKPKTRYQYPARKWIGCKTFGGNFILRGYTKGAWAPWLFEDVQTGRLLRRTIWDSEVDTWSHPRFRNPDPDPEYESLLV